MYVRKVTKGLLGDYLSSLHVKLAESVDAAVGGALSGGHLSLSQLARSVKSAVAVRYRVKRIDRLLGNASLHSARLEIYRKLAARWLSGLDNVLVLIDWSDATTDQRWHLLRASIAVEGRSVTLYEEIHPQRAYGNLAVHRRFLTRLSKLLPVACQPTLITDAGFHSTWFDLVTEHHWPWIGRIRGKDMVSIAEGPWRRCTDVFVDATSRNQAFPDAQYVRSRPTPCLLILSKRVSKGRHRRTRMGKQSRSHASLKAARNAREPLLLACSPGHSLLNAAEIIAMYAKRMQIEQSFRDLKNERLGLGFSEARSHSVKRLEILLLIAHLSSWLMRLIGECAQKYQMQRYFQSVPGLKHKEISVLTLARRVIDAGAEWLTRLRPQEAVASLHQQARAAYHGD
jgi:hypothetical protein